MGTLPQRTKCYTPSPMDILRQIVINKDGHMILFLGLFCFFFHCGPDPWFACFWPGPKADLSLLNNKTPCRLCHFAGKTKKAIDDATTICPILFIVFSMIIADNSWHHNAWFMIQDPAFLKLYFSYFHRVFLVCIWIYLELGLLTNLFFWKLFLDG